MQQRVTAIVVFAWLVFLAMGSAAHAQRPPSVTREDIDALKKEMEELRQQTVQIPTLAAAVQELTTRLARLEERLETQGREQKAIPDALAGMDRLDEQARKLAMDVEALRTQVAQLEQPWTPESTSGGVAYDDGFAWTTSDGRYAIKIGGYLQGRYALEVEDDIEENELRLRRARVGMSGHLGSEKLTYRVLLSGGSSPPLLDYHVDYAFRDELVVRFGQYKTQFTRNFITSSSRLAFIERPLGIENLRYDRDIQVGVLGQLAEGRVGYYAGVGNGAGPNKRNDNIDVNATVRADVTILGKRFSYAEADIKRTDAPALMLGAGLVHDLTAMPAEIGDLAINNDVDGNGDIDNVRVVSASMDAVFRYRGFEASLEALFRYEGFGTILKHPDNAGLVAAVDEGDRRTYVGVFTQASWLLPRDILVGGRLGISRVPFLGVGGQPSRLPRADRVIEVDGLVQLYRKGFRRLGLLVTHHHYPARDESAEVQHANRLLLEAQIVF